MHKNSVTYINRRSVFFTILLTVSLLLSGCTPQSDKQDQTQPTESTTTTEVSGTTQNAQTSKTEPDTNTAEDPSLAIFRQAMVETPQLFAAAFFGHVSQGADPFTVMQTAAPQLCEDLPFLLTIDQNHVLGVEGQLFCIVPADENASVAVNRRPWNAEINTYEEPEVLYHSESGSPILVMCPNDDRIPDTEVVITDSNGTVATWSPYLDPDHRLSALCNDNGESLIFDFTSYDELPNSGGNPGVDSSELVGNRELARTEAEGD